MGTWFGLRGAVQLRSTSPVTDPVSPVRSVTASGRPGVKLGTVKLVVFMAKTGSCRHRPMCAGTEESSTRRAK